MENLPEIKIHRRQDGLAFAMRNTPPPHKSKFFSRPFPARLGRNRPESIHRSNLGRPALGPAVDPQGLAGDEFSHGSGEEFDDSGHLVDHRDSLEGSRLSEAALFHIPRPEKSSGSGVARSQTVDRDVVGAQLPSEASGVFHNRGLGGGVDGSVDVALEGGDGADVDDPPLFSGHHAAGDVLIDQDGGEEIPV